MDTQPLSYAFDAWCRLRGVSRSTAYALLRAGTGPQTYLIGSRRYVSARADQEWVDLMESRPAPLETPPSLRRARGA
jgi:predicted DNA-binding transcriptional regulator AlpA